MSLEIMVVFAISIGLMSIVIPQAFTYLRKSRTLTIISNIRATLLAIESFHLLEGRYPKDISELVETGYISNVPDYIRMERNGDYKIVVNDAEIDQNMLKTYFPNCVIKDNGIIIKIKGSKL